MKILTVFGTRPEAIKMAPVIAELKRRPCDFMVKVAVSAQHRELLDQVLDIFEIQPDYDLNIMKSSQSLSQITRRVLHGVEEILQDEKPDFVLVQGDTTTTFAGALAAFYQKIPVGHIEAGLRTYNKYNPFPEEKNRQLVSALADLHFAPTQSAKANLLREGIPSNSIYVTGNTVVDALMTIIQKEFEFNEPPFSAFDFDRRKFILVTSHRRENWGKPMESICLALKDLVLSNKDIEVVFSVHPNPVVYNVVHGLLGKIERIHLIESLSYIPFVHLMNRVYFILTDSGGIQEEAPSLSKPVLLMRETTERPEGVEKGMIKLVGTDRERILMETQRLLDNRQAYEEMIPNENPFGDGKAAFRIVNSILDSKQRELITRQLIK